jgi:UDP-2,3-diacylglucosamine hydrolase
MDIVAPKMLAHMVENDVNCLIHGHIHQPGLTHHQYENQTFQQYVLSDWDDRPSLLCYYKTLGFKFIRLMEKENAG